MDILHPAGCARDHLLL